MSEQKPDAAGLAEAHAEVLASGRENGYGVRELSLQKSFDVFASEYLIAGLLTYSVMEESIPVVATVYPIRS
jgi:hypothetical protein